MMSFANYNLDPTHPPTASDDDPEPGPSNFLGIKRGSRACDRCRKLKSKCEPTQGERCKNCVSAGTSCTFQGPSFKRGPPKGYIHAIEQRWHQVECILASIMVAPQAQGIISELRGDPFARTVLDRVKTGPYGPQSRGQPHGTSSENFYATIMGGSDTPTRDDRRGRRQSRMTREIVSIEDSNIHATPTPEWQEGLICRLTGDAVQQYASRSSPSITASRSPTSDTSSTHQGQGEPRTRRRLEGTYVPEGSLAQRNWSEQYSGSYNPYSNWDEVDDAVDSFGHLALDDMKEIRYHGHASGLPLLARSDNPAGADKANGLWKFPAIKQEQPSGLHALLGDNDLHIRLPPVDVQIHLANLYFAWVHPFFPVIHKQQFWSNFPIQEGKTESPSTDSAHHSTQRVNKLLLLAMFSVASRYGDATLWNLVGENISNAGAHWVVGAREIISGISQSSRPSTVQALLLLGIREFGVGSMEQGWALTGMALRMAVDLGLNRNADRWTHNGQELFNSLEKHIRKQIWWACCIMDKLSAMWMGRPVTFRGNDYTTLKPDVVQDEDFEMWRPFPGDAFGPTFAQRQARVMSCFHEQCELSVIITDIMDQIYPVKSPPDGPPRRLMLQRLEERLHKWQISLPDHLRYSATSSAETPLPHILILQIEYYSAVLLLHRAFIPHANGRLGENAGGLRGDPLPLKSFDICQSAASQISALVSLFDGKYGLHYAPSFLTIYLQSAGIMHVITLFRCPDDPRASKGLEQCIDALAHLGDVWPSAKRVRVLLDGATRPCQQARAMPSEDRSTRPKRSAEEALGEGTGSAMYQRSAVEIPHPEPGVMNHRPGFDEDSNTRAMLQSLGLDAPGVDQMMSTFLPAYQYLPRHPYDEMGQGSFVDVSAPGPSPVGPVHEHTISDPPFTFNQNDLTPQFVQGVHYPILDPSNLFPMHQGYSGAHRSSHQNPGP